MVAQEVLDLLAAAAPDDPEKVQDALEGHGVSSQADRGNFREAHFGSGSNRCLGRMSKESREPTFWQDQEQP